MEFGKVGKFYIIIMTMIENKKTILLVEDEIIIAISEQQQLEDMGYNVISVTNGEAAINKILYNDTIIDLILMDIDLGSGMDGTEAAAIILKEKEIPVIFLSSHTESETVRKTEKITSYGYSLKNSGIMVLDASIKMAFKLFEADMNFKNELAERKKIEKSLKESENFFKSQFYNSPDIILIIDKNFKVIKINKTLTDKVQTDELMGFNIIDLLHDENKDPALKKLSECFQTGKSVEFEHDLKNGLWVYARVVPMVEDDAVSHVMVISTDITERKRIEAESFQNIELLTLFIKHSPIYTYIKSITPDVSRVIYASENFIDMIGIPESSMIGKSMEELFPLEFAKKITADDWKVISEGKILTFNEDLDDRHYITIKYPIIQENRKLLAGYTIDITDIKHAEEILSQRELELRTLMDNLPDIVMRFDLQKKVIYANSSVIKSFDIHQKQSCLDMDQTCTIFDMDFPKEFALKMDGDLQKVIDTEKTINDYCSLKIGDELKHIDIIAMPEFDVDRTMNSILLIGRDITDRKINEESINRQLQEKILLLKEVHHRIKNNITSIGSLIKIQAGATNNDEAKNILLDTVSRIESMRFIYDKLLLTDDYKEASVKYYLEDLIMAILSLFPERGKISVNVFIDDFKMNVKPLFPLGIMVNELITNSMKYAFVGKDTGNIDINLTKKDNDVLLSVKDDGNGLPEDFDLEKSRGFGLFLVKMLSKQLDAQFDLSNANGTRCRIKFNI